jgi:hypothetical protein
MAMEQTDWIHKGFDAAQVRFLMVTAITHHRFSSPIWGEQEVRKLYDELAEIDASVAQVEAPRPARWRLIWPGIRGAITRRSRRARSSRRPLLNAWLGLP